MPLSAPRARRELHHRIVDMHCYARDDGLFDVEAHLLDTRGYTALRFTGDKIREAGQPVHDIRVRLTLDEHYVVRDVEASSDITPYALCRETEATVKVLIGEAVVAGWSSKVKAALRGAASCNHLLDMLVTMASTAYQGIRAFKRLERGEIGEKSVPRLDSCYSYAADREVVRMYWPAHYRGRSGGDTKG